MAVRLERVVVDLDDRFSRPAANMAASTALLRKRTDEAGRSVDAFGRSSDRAGPAIDRFSGRVRILADVAAIVGPALAPIGATAIPALTGLASQFGFAAVAGGTAITAFQGVGEALDAMNKARLEPTAENLEAARREMEQISPAAREFVQQIQTMIPQLTHLRDAAAEGMFPGLTDALDTITTRLPDVERILSAVGGALGDIAADSADSLASARWDDFFEFLATDAPEALREMATATGNVAHAMGEFWMAFDPLNDDFSRWLVDATGRLDDFASGLSESDGFLSFIDYVRTNGPRVGAALGAIANMLVQVVQAAAPLGGPVLRGLEATADVIASIADSDLGTPIFTALAALALYNRALGVSATLSRGVFSGPMVTSMRNQAGAVRGLAADWRAYSAVTRTAQGRAQASATQMVAHRAAAERLGSTLRTTGANAAKAGVGIGALALLTSGAGDKMNLTNTAALGLAGTLAGPWGAAAGAAAGLLLDAKAAADQATASLDFLNAAIASGNLDAMTKGLAQAKDQLEDLKRLSGIGDVFSTISEDIGFTLRGDFNGRRDAVKAYEKAIRDAKVAIEDAKDEAGDTAAFEKQAEVLAANRTAAGNVARQFVGLGDSLDDAKVSLSGWIKQLAKQADALSNFASNAQKAADRGLRKGLIKALQEAGPAGAMRMKQLANATDTEISRANKAWAKGQRAIRNYTDTVGGVPKSKTTTIQEKGASAAGGRISAMKKEINLLRSRMVTMDEKGAAAARDRIAALKRSIDALRDKSIEIRTTHITNVIRRRAGSSIDLAADGTTVPKTGMGYADRHLYLLADGEEVISNRHGQADRHRELLKAINSNRLADGGTVDVLRRFSRGAATASASSLAGAGIDYDRLASLLARGGNTFPISLGQAVDVDDLVRRIAFAQARAV